MSNLTISWRQFLRGRLRGMAPVRPPWALAEATVLQTCDRCGEWSEACPSRAIRLDPNTVPLPLGTRTVSTLAYEHL